MIDAPRIRKLSVEPLGIFIPKEAEQSQLQIIVTLSILEKIWAHVKSTVHREVGGLIVGDATYQDQHIIINIQAAICSQNTESTAASLCFTFNTWDDLYRKMYFEYPKYSILGWYHSHPGFGLFLSYTDQQTHSSFFYQPWHLALILDPVSEEKAFFYMRGDKIISVEQVLTVED